MTGLIRIRSLVLGLIAVGLAGCGGSQPSSYYMLSSLPAPETPVRSASTDQIAIGIGPVSLPAYLDRPQLVTRASANRLDLSEFNRWAEPLQEMFSRTLAENVSTLVGTDLVYVLPRRLVPNLDYVVAVEVLRFDRGVDGKAELLARWTVLTGDEDETLSVRKTLIAERVSPDSGTEDVIVAMSRTVEGLSREIARDLQGIADMMPVSVYDLRAIQDALRSMGYAPGPADGLMGPRTREAIRRFQGEHGVQVTGKPSRQLQDMLMARP
jgi:uncharacterized lipoprotein YmbA